MAKFAIKEMSVEEKISTMEEIWDALCNQGKIESPDWHGDILRAREQSGETPMNWAEAKEDILSEIK